MPSKRRHGAPGAYALAFLRRTLWQVVGWDSGLGVCRPVGDLDVRALGGLVIAGGAFVCRTRASRG